MVKEKYKAKVIKYFRVQEVIGESREESHLMGHIKTRTITRAKTLKELMTKLPEAEERLKEEERRQTATKTKKA